MKDLVSIIVPVYNVENYLNKCIDSIIKQTYTNIEIILVDDGSTDASGKICDEYAKIDNRIKVIHKFNGGLSSARNVGIEHANGNFISFIDSDDWVGENFIASFCKYAASDTIIICGYKKVINQLINVNGVKYILFLNRFQFENLLMSYELINSRTYGINPIGNYMMTKFFPSWVFKDIRFPEGHVFEDAFISMKLFNKIEKYIILPETEYYYVFRNNSIVNTPKKDNLFDAILARIEQENDLSYNKQLQIQAYILTVYVAIDTFRFFVKGAYDLNNNEKYILKNIVAARKKYITFKDWKLSIKIFLFLNFELFLKLIYKLK